MNSYIVDANIIIRFLTNDDDKQSLIAFRLFEKAVNSEIELVIQPITIAECIWVLESKRYGYSSEEIANHISKLLTAPNIKTIEEATVLKSLHQYCIQNVDFIDVFLAEISKVQRKPILTWNEKHFKRLSVEFYKPNDLMD